MNEGDREALQAHPEIFDVPVRKILDGRVMVAEREAIVRGFVTVLRRADGEAELDGLFVEPSAWRAGIGRKLVDAAEAMALRDGSIALHVVGNPHAEGFYLACGFQQVGTIQTQFGPGMALLKALTDGHT